MASETKRPWEGEAETGSFGAWLRRQREVREISLREIAETSKISIRYLEALEQDRFDLLPAPLFAKGFLREYAKFVGLDPDEVVNYYLSALPQDEPAEKSSKREAPRRRISPAAVLGVVLFAVILGAALWYLSYRAEHAADEVPAMAPPPRTEMLPAVTTAALSAPIRVSLDFHQKGWVEAFVDGERTVSEFRVQGESLSLSALREVRLSLRNPAGVTVEVNGRPYVGPLEADEEIIIDLATVGSAEGGQDRR